MNNSDSIKLDVVHQNQPATLTVDAQTLLVQRHDTTTISYPTNTVYGVQQADQPSSFTILMYGSSSSTSSGSDSGAVTGNQRREQHTLTLKLTSCDEQIDKVIKRIVSIVLPHYDHNAQTTVYPFLNPTSGQQKARQQFNDTVKPILSSAGFQFTSVIETEQDKVRLQALELGQQILQHKGPSIILCLGGDGTLHDLVNGLLDALAQHSDQTISFASVFRLGVIPAGSGNAFSLSLNLEDIGHAALRIIHGNPQPFHLLDVGIGHAPPATFSSSSSSGDSDDSNHWTNHLTLYPQQERRRIFVVMSWGFHAQIVSKSRYLRYVMGNKRFSLVAMALLFFLHHYKGQVVMKHVKRYNPSTHEFDHLTTTTTAGHDRVTLDSQDDQGGFTYFLTTKQSSLERGFNITPFASPFTQDMDVICLRQATGDQLKTVAGLAFQGGKHVDEPIVDYYKTTELYLRVDEATDICLDGEIVPIKAKDVIRLTCIQDEKIKDALVVYV